MSEDFLSNHSGTTSSKREIKNKIKIKIKRVKVMKENYEILKFNEHANLLNHKYSVPELKKMCRHYKIKVSGNKEELLKRLHEHLLKSSFAIKIEIRTITSAAKVQGFIAFTNARETISIKVTILATC